jgi:hypothetical protein
VPAHLLFPDSSCPACAGRHTLYHLDVARHPRGAAFRYTCPSAKAVVVFHPGTNPELTIRIPADAVPLKRLRA